MAGYSARQSSFTTGDTITAAHSNNEFNQILAAFHVSTGHTHDGTTAGDGGPLSTLYSNAVSMGTGADTDIVLTFNANSNDGVLTWMEDEDYFKFSDDLLINSTEKVQFRDTAIYLYSSADGQLDVVADSVIQVTAPTVNIEASTAVTIESDSITLGENGDTDIVLTFNANSADGVLTWMEDEDYFKFSDDVLINSTEKLYFYDTGLYIYSSTDGQLDLVADTEIQIAATTVDINGNVDISGTLTIGSAGISEAELEILDGATVTTTELNIIDGDTSATGTTVADADRVVYNDAGTMKQVAVTDLDTYVSGTTKTLTNKTLTSPVLNTGVSGTAIADEDDMSSNSATKLATQQSIKAYVDSEVGGAGSMSNFILEDDDGTEVTISNAKEVKFIGSGLTTNWTDTDNGTDGDPFDMTFTVDAAQTGITSILATDLKIGEDDQTKIDFETADEIHFYAANVEQVYLADNIFGPQSDSDVDLGTTGVRWKDAYIDTITTTGAVTVGGDLTVNGTTTTVNSTTITVDDPIFTLGGDTAPGSDDNKDRGIEFRYHNGTAAKIGFFGWDDSATAFTFIPDATNSSEVFSGTVGNAVFGNITGTLATAAQTNITSVGALDGGSITSGFGTIDTGSSNITTTGLISGGSLDIDNVLINGTTIGHTDDTDLLTLASGALTVAGTIEGTTITASTALVPDASGGANLGSASLEWGDLYIADDKKIYLGSDQNLSIEYDEDGNDTTAIVAAGGLSMAPHGTSAGNGTELRFQELAANGANYVGFKAPDAIAANKVFILPNADGSANQVLKTDGSLGLGWVDQASAGTVSLVADGSITAGKPCIITSAGKAAQVAATGEAVTESIGSNQAIDTSNLKYISTCKLADTKFLLVYNDIDGSNYPTARIGTVDPDNKTISYGTAVVLASSSEYTHTTCAYDTNESRIGIFCTSTTAYSIKAVTGSFSGTTLSMNSFADLGSIDAGGDIFPHALYDPDNNAIVVVVEGAADNDTLTAMEVDVSGTSASVNFSAAKTSTDWRGRTRSMENTITYDTSTNRFVYIFEDEDDSDNVKGIVLANSGTAFTWGNASSSAGSSSPNTAFAIEYDAAANKTIAFWNEGTTVKYAVGTVTGGTTNSISWGTAANAIGTTAAHRQVLARHHVASGKTLLAASDGTDLKMYVTTTSGTSVSVSGTSYTIGTDELFDYASMTPELSTNNESIVIAGSSASGTDTGKSYVFNAGQTVGTNLTTSNFLGLAAASISDTATGDITIIGGVSENQSSLTVGSQYYVQGDGTLGTSADTVSVVAGLSISATKLIVKT